MPIVKNEDGTLRYKVREYWIPKPWVGLNAKGLSEIPPSCFEGAIWADGKLRNKNT